MKKRLLTLRSAGLLALLTAAFVLLPTEFVKSQAPPPPPQPTDADLLVAGYRVKEPTGPPVVTREQAVAAVRSFLDSVLGPTRGQRIHGRPAATRHLLLSEDPNLVDFPVWVVAFYDVSTDDLPMPCGGLMANSEARLECPTKALYVIVDATQGDAIGFTTLGSPIIQHPRP